MRTAALGVFAATALVGCAQTGPSGPPAGASATPAADSCGRSEWTRYIGRPRTELSAPSDPGRVRIHSTTDAVTMDYREDRVNVIWDEATGRVVEVRCG